MSFFTFLFFGFLVKVLIYDSKFELFSTIAFALFGVYTLVFSGFDQITTIITIISGLLLIKKADVLPVEGQPVIYSLSLGLAISSVVALFRENLPLIDKFLSNATLKLGEGEFADRFAALEGNPNYFTLGVNFAIACLVAITLKEKPRVFHFILIGALTWFGLMSISQSFLLGYAALIVLWFISAAYQGGASGAIKFLVFGAILAGLVYLFASDSIDVFVRRFSNEEGATLNTISTGRFGIWQTYIEEIFHSPRILLFGSGLNRLGSVGRATHNTYFEVLYSLGLCGSILMLFAMHKAFDGVKWGLALFIPIAVLLVRMFGISLITYDNFWIYLVMLKMLGVSFSTSKEIKEGDGNT